MSFLKFWQKKKEDNQVNANLTKLGLTTITDEKFGTRLALYDDFCTYVAESHGLEGDAIAVLDTIIERASHINNVLHQAAIPFGRAGTSKGYMMIASGWSKLYTIVLDVASSVKHQLENLDLDKSVYAPEMQKSELVLKLRHFFEAYYLKYALIVAAASWMKEDVSPSWAITIQAPPQAPGFMPTTMQYPKQFSAGGEQQKKPQDWGKPEYIDSKSVDTKEE